MTAARRDRLLRALIARHDWHSPVLRALLLTGPTLRGYPCVWPVGDRAQA